MSQNQIRVCILASAAVLISGVLCYCPAQEDKVSLEPVSNRNPFIPLVASDGRLLKLSVEVPRGGLLLEGIIYDTNSSSYAIVNSSVVRVGDAIDGYEVAKIEKNKVVFIRNGQFKELEIETPQE